MTRQPARPDFASSDQARFKTLRWAAGHAIHLALILALLPSCLVEPIESPALVTLAFPLDQLGLPLEDLPGPRSADGLVHLDLVPAYIQVQVSGPGMNAPLVTAWPEAGSMNPRRQVELEFEVPAGRSRQFAILAYVYQGGTVRTWRDDGSLVVDLEGGQSSELSAPLVPVDRVALSCEITGTGVDEVLQAVAVDGDPEQGFDTGPGVAWPPVEVQDGLFEITDIPVGRTITFRLLTEETGQVLLPPVQVQVSGPDDLPTCEIAIP